jgi:lipopolysaccharide/colanic/teichoic acid biosynthesis glycosyltransferase
MEYKMIKKAEAFRNRNLFQENPPQKNTFRIQIVLKQVMDRIGAAAGLILLSPVFLIVAALLKLEGQGGSIFYGGYRVGKDGQKFRCWKFRSMEPNSDHIFHAYLKANPEAQAHWDAYRKLENDPRVTTRTARLIRKLSIDELPQLWNVLMGDMSLVGPRPILEDEVHYFGSNYKIYCAARPGITGLWQVSGRSETTYFQRVLLDRQYVRRWSLWRDIAILFKTVQIVALGKGAY